MTNRTGYMIAAALAVAVLGTGMAPPAAADMGAVKERQNTMKAISKANKTVQGAAKGKVDGAKAAAAANEIAMLAGKISGLFPKGTSSKELAKATRAKPDIWMEMDKFKGDANGLKAAAEKVAKVAAMGDKAALAAAAKGLEQACTDCHKSFRGPKPKK